MSKSKISVLVISSDYFCYKIKKFHLSNIDLNTITESTFKSIGIFGKFLLLKRYDIVHFFFVKNSSTTVSLSKLAGAKIINHYIGTDVYNLMNASSKTKKKSVSNSKKISKNLAVSEHLVEELRTLGITNVEYFPIFFSDPIAFYDSEAQFRKNKILTYIPEGREEFYGLSFILEIADKFPEVEIIIAGHSGKNGDYPSNITFLGWTDNFLHYLMQCSIFIRKTEHDGLPNTVLEALMLNKYVLYNHNFPHTLDTTVENLNRLLNKDIPNNDARNFVIEHFNNQKIIKSLNQLYLFVSKNK